MRKRTIALGVVVIIVVALFIVVASSASDDSRNRIEYSYTYELAESYDYVTPDEGDTLVVATITMTNVSYADGLLVNFLTLDAQLEVDGKTYAWHSHSNSTVQGLTLEEGHTADFIVLFEIPADSDLSTLTIDVTTTPTYGCHFIRIDA